jgi:hypothetical protein
MTSTRKSIKRWKKHSKRQSSRRSTKHSKRWKKHSKRRSSRRSPKHSKRVPRRQPSKRSKSRRHSGSYKMTHGPSEVDKQLESLGVILNLEEKLNIELLKTVIIGIDSELKALIAGGADVDAKDKDGNSAVILAAINNNLAGLKELIDAGADVTNTNNKGQSALSLCWTPKCKDLIQDAMNMDLLRAVLLNNTQKLKSLIKDGADVNAKDDFGQTAVHFAAALGFTDCLKELIVAGADVSILNKDNKPPISFCDPVYTLYSHYLLDDDGDGIKLSSAKPTNEKISGTCKTLIKNAEGKRVTVRRRSRSRRDHRPRPSPRRRSASRQLPNLYEVD